MKLVQNDTSRFWRPEWRYNFEYFTDEKRIYFNRDTQKHVENNLDSQDLEMITEICSIEKL